jgi:hypothetical protein
MHQGNVTAPRAVKGTCIASTSNRQGRNTHKMIKHICLSSTYLQVPPSAHMLDKVLHRSSHLSNVHLPTSVVLLGRHMRW